MHTLYDVETQVPAFFHITEAAVHDSKAMCVIPYEPGSYYVFDRGYNDFKQLYRIEEIGSYFVVRAKKNLQYKVLKWKRRMPANVLSDAEIELTGFYTSVPNFNGTLVTSKIKEELIDGKKATFPSLITEVLA